MVLREPVVRMLFEHGLFHASDTMATASVLGWLALGLPAHVLLKTLSPAFFARDDTQTPLWATLQGLVVAILAGLLLGRLYGASGVAAGIALGAWGSALALLWRGAASFGLALDEAASRRLPRIAAAAVGMGALLWLKALFVLPLAANAATAVQAAVLVVLIASGILVYGLLLALFGVIDLAGAAIAFRRAGASDLRD
jgi:putative peptidoglycan lipid II flippase